MMVRIRENYFVFICSYRHELFFFFTKVINKKMNISIFILNYFSSNLTKTNNAMQKIGRGFCGQKCNDCKKIELKIIY